MADRYDGEIKVLTTLWEQWDSNTEKGDNPIAVAWNCTTDCEPSLFARLKNCFCCLTEARRDLVKGTDHEFRIRRELGDAMADQLKQDSRIPVDGDNLTPDDLPVFAEWQRKIDAMGIR